MIDLEHPAERGLALSLLQFSESPHQGDGRIPAQLPDRLPVRSGQPLFDLLRAVPRAQGPHEASRTSRLLLCDLTARTIRLGLELLGIRVVERASLQADSHGNTKCTADATAVGYRQRRILRASVADFGLGRLQSVIVPAAR